MKIEIDKPSAVDPLPAAGLNPVHAVVRDIYREFARAMPAGVKNVYRPREEDPVAKIDDARAIEVPDGTYRVLGTDWLITFRRNRFMNATLATPENEFGGKEVIEVPTDYPTSHGT